VAVVTEDSVRIHKYLARSHQVWKAGDFRFSQTIGFFRSLKNSQCLAAQEKVDVLKTKVPMDERFECGLK
jgi:hypothetical protein